MEVAKGAGGGDDWGKRGAKGPTRGRQDHTVAIWSTEWGRG